MTHRTDPPGVRDLARLRQCVWWTLVPSPAVMFGFTVWAMVRDGEPAVRAGVTAVVLAVAAVGPTWSFLRVTGTEEPPPVDRREIGMLTAAAGALAVLAVTADPSGAAGFGLLTHGAVLATAVLLRLPAGRRPVGLAAVTILAIGVAAGLSWWRGLPASTVTVAGLGVFSIATGLWMSWWQYDVARQLELARRVTGELAVARERLRFAAELHDIQGHHLQVIALKSELAARLRPDCADEAVALMREVQQLAHDALRDTRAVVAGYRRVSLRTEIGNASRVLSSAGIDTAVRLPPGDTGWHESVERDMGLLVREATTNVLRHASPRRCELTLEAEPSAMVITIRNDGADEAPVAAAGTGLTGLRDRFTAASGALDWEHASGWFTIRGRLPAAAGTGGTS
ncbi:two-component system sensor histidine kinase DesK [Stackebrandtia albiflava]|uniref:Two-component system sensor histidine kinase DesK n=1 Tax=Stackebrandtia albiflava TaxID=406432 RepID=A0A562VD34_9ACTN|nr:histidine kinase [Stackebrandtia albiflava]TWJ15721.1 two-component system sensor histidine kinase DesK [Stackebrandtia albiflava]